MGSLCSSNKKRKEDPEMALNKAKNLISSYPVVVFSKTYCGYCSRVKQLLTELQASFKVIELNVEMLHNTNYLYRGIYLLYEGDGNAIQSALAEWTGVGTVPNVFIGGKHIGGSDAFTEKYKRDQLVPLLIDAGAIAK